MKQSRVTEVEQQIDTLVELMSQLSLPQQAQALHRLRIKLDTMLL